MPILMAMGALTLELRCFAFYYPQFVLFRGLFSCLGWHILAVRVTHVSGVHRNRHRMACRGVAASFESFLFFSSHIVLYDDVTRYITEQKSEYSFGTMFLKTFALVTSAASICVVFVFLSAKPPNSPIPHPRQHISTRNDPLDVVDTFCTLLASVSVLSFVRPQQLDPGGDAADIFSVSHILATVWMGLSLVYSVKTLYTCAFIHSASFVVTSGGLFCTKSSMS